MSVGLVRSTCPWVVFGVDINDAYPESYRSPVLASLEPVVISRLSERSYPFLSVKGTDGLVSELGRLPFGLPAEGCVDMGRFGQSLENSFGTLVESDPHLGMEFLHAMIAGIDKAIFEAPCLSKQSCRGTWLNEKGEGIVHVTGPGR